MEITELTAARAMTGSPPALPVPQPDLVPAGPDRARTVAHLADTVLSALGHATRHLAAAQTAPDRASAEFNLAHAAHHTRQAVDHQGKLVAALAQYHPAVAAELAKLHQVTQPAGLGPPPPPPPPPARAADAEFDYPVAPPRYGEPLPA
jgi:hypothetical protein